MLPSLISFQNPTGQGIENLNMFTAVDVTDFKITVF